MRLRTARLAIIPMWVLSHPSVRGNPTRIATYAGLQVVSFESDTDWRSLRELAVSVSEVIGIGDEACRKHLAQLQTIGALVRAGDDLYLPADDPALGTGVGTVEPSSGSGGTQIEVDTSTYKKMKEKTARSGYDEHPDFVAFYDEYPRKAGKPDALRAFIKARKKVDLNTILDGLDRWHAYWHARNEPQFIPEPSRWLNKEGWADTPPPVSGNGSKKPAGWNAVMRNMERAQNEA